MYDPVKPTVRPDMTVMVRFPNADIGQKGTERKFMVRFEISLDCGTRFWTVATFVRVRTIANSDGPQFAIGIERTSQSNTCLTQSRKVTSGVQCHDLCATKRPIRHLGPSQWQSHSNWNSRGIQLDGPNWTTIPIWQRDWCTDERRHDRKVQANERRFLPSPKKIYGGGCRAQLHGHRAAMVINPDSNAVAHLHTLAFLLQ